MDDGFNMKDPFGIKKMSGGSSKKGGKSDLFSMMGMESPFGNLFPSNNTQKIAYEEETPKIVDIAARNRARSADLVIPPAGYTNCGNCEYFQGNYCNHSKVNQQVESTWCCIYWDAPGTIRVADQ